MVGIGRTPFEIWCEMEKFGGGWLVIQRRFNGSVDFYRKWTEYRNGFGDVAGEFWLDLERIHQLTKNGTWELIVEIKDFADDYEYARYSDFALGNEWSKYTLSKLGTHSGDAGDALSYHKGMKFSTFDRDNDEDDSRHCAEKYHGAWWYKSCYDSNLNGLYTENQEAKAIKWRGFLRNGRNGRTTVYFGTCHQDRAGNATTRLHWRNGPIDRG
ncbi:hypothetical protein pipiens_002738 [Culex pipiens pipiens]|uniref:Fibrinogen C-terminal domain-containing protein n=1 Tax=Culex pipiens pipiens TaxID=38569 RepID=A0ABD1DCI3_CULPP